MVRVLLVLMAAVSLTLGAIALWQTRYVVGVACLSLGAGTMIGQARKLGHQRGTDDA